MRETLALEFGPGERLVELVGHAGDDPNVGAHPPPFAGSISYLVPTGGAPQQRQLIWRVDGPSVALHETALLADLSEAALTMTLPRLARGHICSVDAYKTDHAVVLCILAPTRSLFRVELPLPRDPAHAGASVLAGSVRDLAARVQHRALNVPRGARATCLSATDFGAVVGLSTGAALCVDAAGSTQTTLYDSGGQRLWSGLLSSISRAPASPVTSVSALAGGRIAAVVHGNGRLRVWSLLSAAGRYRVKLYPPLERGGNSTLLVSVPHPILPASSEAASFRVYAVPPEDVEAHDTPIVLTLVAAAELEVPPASLVDFAIAGERLWALWSADREGQPAVQLASLPLPAESEFEEEAAQDAPNADASEEGPGTPAVVLSCWLEARTLADDEAEARAADPAPDAPPARSAAEAEERYAPRAFAPGRFLLAALRASLPPAAAPAEGHTLGALREAAAAALRAEAAAGHPASAEAAAAAVEARWRSVLARCAAAQRAALVPAGSPPAPPRRPCSPCTAAARRSCAASPAPRRSSSPPPAPPSPGRPSTARRRGRRGGPPAPAQRRGAAAAGGGPAGGGGGGAALDDLEACTPQSDLEMGPPDGPARAQLAAVRQPVPALRRLAEALPPPDLNVPYPPSPAPVGAAGHALVGAAAAQSVAAGARLATRLALLASYAFRSRAAPPPPPPGGRRRSGACRTCSSRPTSSRSWRGRPRRLRAGRRRDATGRVAAAGLEAWRVLPRAAAAVLERLWPAAGDAERDGLALRIARALAALGRAEEACTAYLAAASAAKRAAAGGEAMDIDGASSRRAVEARCSRPCVVPAPPARAEAGGRGQVLVECSRAMEEAGRPDLVVRAAYAALPQSGPELAARWWVRIFRFSVENKAWDEAYAALLPLPASGLVEAADGERIHRRDCSIWEEVEAVVGEKARAMDGAALREQALTYYHLAFSLAVTSRDYRRAAEAMADYAHRMASESPADSLPLLQRQVEALAAACHALALVQEPFQWVSAPRAALKKQQQQAAAAAAAAGGPSGAYTPQSPKRRWDGSRAVPVGGPGAGEEALELPPVRTLADLQRAYAVAAARLALGRRDAALLPLAAGMGGDELARLLVRAGECSHALRLADACGLKARPRPRPPRPRASEGAQAERLAVALADAALAAPAQPEAAVQPEEALRALLERRDGPAAGWAAHLAAAQRFLQAPRPRGRARQPPLWLARALKGSSGEFAGPAGDAAGLIREYVKRGALEEAALAAIEVLERREIVREEAGYRDRVASAWLPYAVLDQLREQLRAAAAGPGPAGRLGEWLERLEALLRAHGEHAALVSRALERSAAA
eukprot:tig00000691_g3190.t1